MTAVLEDVAPHAAAAIQYAQEVVDGDQVAGKYEILACRRFLDDLEREDVPWEFNTAAAEKPCRYIERLPHIKGEWAKRRELLTLQPWQCFNVCNVFGWIHTQDIIGEDGETLVQVDFHEWFPVQGIELRQSALSGDFPPFPDAIG